jgi:hypothetical protein
MSKKKSILEDADTAPLTGSPVYLAVVGLNAGVSEDNPDGLRIEPGEIVPDDVIAASPWLIEQGCVTLQEGVNV